MMEMNDGKSLVDQISFVNLSSAGNLIIKYGIALKTQRFQKNVKSTGRFTVANVRQRGNEQSVETTKSTKTNRRRRSNRI